MQRPGFPLHQPKNKNIIMSIQQVKPIKNNNNSYAVLESEGNDELVQIEEQWPSPVAEEALQGLAGDIVRTIEPHTESDSFAILAQFLLFFGNVIGRSAHFKVEATEHYLNLFLVLVGPSSKARKGTSFNQVMRLFKAVAEDWSKECIHAGLSSGEGLIWSVRDKIVKSSPIKNSGKITSYQEEVVDPGISDKRCLVVEEEFRNVLEVMKREGNTLSPVIRCAWDGKPLKVMTKNSPAIASDPHISIGGHITVDELVRSINATEAGNGFGNRFMWICVNRSKVLPEGGQLHTVDLSDIIKRLGEAFRFALDAKEMSRDEEARQLWANVYPELSEGKPGLLGAMIARAEAQVLRLSCLYALLDLSDVVRVEHLQAGLAFWQYCEDSARFIFGESLGDPVADEIKKALDHASDGLSRTDIRDLLKRNKNSGQVGRALEALVKNGLASSKKVYSGGRPIEMWFSSKPSTT
jgi:hypothetical protein